MKRTAFAYEVTTRLEFSLEEARFLRDRAREHYDGACQEAARPGPRGLIHGMVNAAGTIGQGGAGWSVLAFRDVDLLCKVLEPAMQYQPEHRDRAAPLYFELKRVLGELRVEYARLKAAGFEG